MIKVYVVTDWDLFAFNKAVFSSLTKAKKFIENHPIEAEHTYLVEEWSLNSCKEHNGKKVYRKKGTKYRTSNLDYIGTGL